MTRTAADTETRKYAKFLVQFLSTNHPNSTKATVNDLDIARVVLGTDAVTAIAKDFSLDNSSTANDVIYPVEWAESGRAFQSFLRSWRKKFHDSRTPEQTETASSSPATENLTPKSTSPSNDGQPDEQQETTTNYFMPTPFRRPPIGPIDFTTRELQPRQRSNSNPETPLARRIAHVQRSPVTDTDSLHFLLQDLTIVPHTPTPPLRTPIRHTPTPLPQTPTLPPEISHRNSTNNSTTSSPFNLDVLSQLIQTVDEEIQRTTPVYTRTNEQHTPSVRIQTTPTPSAHSSIYSTQDSPSIEIGRATTRAQQRTMSGNGNASGHDNAGPSNATGSSGAAPAPMGTNGNGQTDPAPPAQPPRPPQPPPPPPPFNPNDPVTAAFAAQLITQGFAQNNQILQAQLMGNNSSNLSAEQVGYFNPRHKDPYNSGMVPSGKYCIYTNVYSFTDRLKDLTRSQGDAKVRAVWQTCLQDTAQAWLTEELTPDEKRLLSRESMYEVCERLIRRFKKEDSKALEDLKSKSFTLWDLKAGRELRPFVQGVIRDAKACDLPLKSQLMYAFQAFDFEIQTQLSKPTEETTLGQFMERIDNRESILKAKADALITAPPIIPPAPIESYYSRQHPQNSRLYRYNPTRTTQYQYRGYNYHGYRNRPNYGDRRGNYMPQNNSYAQQHNAYPPQNNNSYSANRPQTNYQTTTSYRPPQQQQNNNYQQHGVNQRPNSQDRQGQGTQQRQGQNQGQQRGMNTQQPRFQRNAQEHPGYYPQQRPAYPPYQQRNRVHWGEEQEVPEAFVQDSQPPDMPHDYDFAQDPNFDPNQPPYYEQYADETQPQPDYGMWTAQTLDEQHNDPIMSYGSVPTDFGPPQTSDSPHDAANFGSFQQPETTHKCKICGEEFSSRNKLFRHIRSEHGRTRQGEDMLRTLTRDTHSPASDGDVAFMSLAQDFVVQNIVTQDSAQNTVTHAVTQDIVTNDAQIAIASHPILHETHLADDRMNIQNVLNENIPTVTNPHQLYKTPETTGRSHMQIVQSDIDPGPDIGTGFTYKAKSYTKFFLMTDPTTEHEEEICGDTGCTRSLADKSWLLQHYPGTTVRTRATPMLIRGISDSEVITSEYAVIRFYFKGGRDGKPVVASFVREVTLINGLPAHMLLGTDILDAENIDIIMSRKLAIIQSCKTAIPISVTPSTVRRDRARVLCTEDVTIDPHVTRYIDVSHTAQFGQDSFFEPTTDRLSCYATIANDTTDYIIVHNDSDKPVSVPKNTHLGYLTPMEQGIRGMHVDDEAASTLALRKPSHNERDSENRLFGSSTDFIVSTTGKSKKHDIGVTIYDEPSRPEIHSALVDLVTEFSDVFVDKGYAKVPFDELPQFLLKPGWEDMVAKKCRPYNVSGRDREFIKDTIMKLVEQGRVFRTKGPVPLSHPVFVVWKNILGKGPKGRMVVDTRNFNKMNLTDQYPMKSQEAMLRKFQGKLFWTILDAVAFYYQWQSHPATRWMMTVTTMDGQFTFNCLIMGYKNSNAYVQRQMDILLDGLDYADCYCDDIIIASDSFDEHINDLRHVLTLLRQKNISIGPNKSFVGFPEAVVLGRLADSLGLATSKERLAAIAKIKFPVTLKDLETFIGLAGYMRSYVPRFAELIQPLDKRKAALLHTNKRQSTASSARARWSASIPVDTPTEAERLSFESIKQALTKHTILHYHNPRRPLCIDFDVSRIGIGVTVYHIAEKALPKVTQNDKIYTYCASTAMEPIAFLSRTLSSAEKKYWPTEMEVLGAVWTLKKTRAFTDIAETGVYCFTDHKAILGMSRHADLVNSTALSSKNLRLVRAMEFISKFDVTFIHKPGKLHVVPDALSRLPATEPSHPQDAPGGLDELPDDREEHWNYLSQAQDDFGVLYETALPAIRLAATRPDEDPTIPPSSKGVALVQMNPEFRDKMWKGYRDDPKWAPILTVLQANETLHRDNAATLPFHIRDKLIWKKSDTMDRLCVPRSCNPEIFQLLHGEFHRGHDKMKDELLYFVLNRKELSKYMKACPECAVLRTRNHKPYGSLQPIMGPPCPFHTITLDLATGFPMSKTGFNAIGLSVDKFSKLPLIVKGRHDWNAQQWAKGFHNSWLSSYWGIPKVIISDRDPRWLGDFWKTVWKQLGTKLLYTTAYHAQTDGQTERAILRVKSACRYLFHALDDPAEWDVALPRLQYELASTPAAATTRSPLEIVTGYTPNFTTGLLAHDEFNMPKSRLEVHDAIATASMTAKKYYDRKHKPMFFEVGDKVMLRLHKGYNIPTAAILGRKLGQQYAGPFVVEERVGRLAYKLKFPAHFRIHNVVSVDHLEPAPPMDVFGRTLPHAGEVCLESHERKIVQEKDGKYLVEYLGLGPEYTKWLTKAQLKEDFEQLYQDFSLRT